MNKKLKVPKFKNEAQERAFWSKANLSDYFKPADFDAVSFPYLKPTSRPISLRVPEYLLRRVKEQANELNVPYQSLLKKYIADGILKK